MPLFSSRVRAADDTAGRRVSAVEALESRCLLTVVPVAGFTPGDVTGAIGSTGSVELTRFVDDDATMTHMVRMSFPTGSVDIQTFDAEVPLNVRNFLSYVRGGPAGDGYEGTYFHRFVADFVLQGGSFYPRGVSGTSLGEPVDETGQPTVTDEVAPGAGRSNTRGTLAFARQGGNPDSAGSGFFFNLNDNGANLNFQNGGFDVFGELIAGTDAGGAPTSDPIAGVILPLAQLPDTQRLITDAVVLEPTVTFTATSSNPSAIGVVNPTTPEGRLGLQFTGPVGSTSQITVTATQPGQASPVTLTFNATVTAAPNLQVTLGGPDGAKSVTFTEADGTVATVSVKGAGTATVTLAGAGLTQQAPARGKVTVAGSVTGVETVALAGGSASTAVTIVGKGGSDGAISLAGLTSDSALRSLSARTAAVTGPVTLGGPVGKLDLGSVTGATVTIGGTANGTASAVTLGTATGASITSAGPLKSVTAASFAAQGQTRGTITAPALAALTSKGGFAQNVTVSGAVGKVSVAGDLSGTITADSVRSVSVRGAIANASINATRPFAASDRPLGRITVAGTISSASIVSAGNMTGVTAGGLQAVTIFAGVSPAVNQVTLPSQPSDFAAQATIPSVTVRGASQDFSIAAFTLGKVNLGTLTTANNGTPFGLAADSIKSVAGTIGAGRQSLRNLNTPEDVTQQTGGADLGDFRIVVL